MGIPSPSYSITMRIHLNPQDKSALGRATTAIGEAGGVVTAVDFVEPGDYQTVVDISANASDAVHVKGIERRVNECMGVQVHTTSDRTFLLHLKGKIEVRSRVPLNTRDDLSMAYTPGVARVCAAIFDRPEDARSLTIKGNSVAIVTDGSAVLGLGDIGPTAALPVMEGKAVLFKRFADIDAWPVCLDCSSSEEIIAAVQAISPAFGGINLEDIAAPKCFEVEERLRDRLDIPVFHDDQHGTAIVVMAALFNALRLVGKDLTDIRVAMSGAGAAGMAIAKLLLGQGAGDIIVSDRVGILHRGRHDLNNSKRWLAENTNKGDARGSVEDSLRGADVFIGVSGPDVIQPIALRTMRRDSIVFAMANPEPEVNPEAALEYAMVVATGRSDYPNQINNVLAFPGVFRGVLDAGAARITEKMKIAAARAIASIVDDGDLEPAYVIPSVFDKRVATAVSKAVQNCWTEVAR